MNVRAIIIAILAFGALAAVALRAFTARPTVSDQESARQSPSERSAGGSPAWKAVREPADRGASGSPREARQQPTDQDRDINVDVGVDAGAGADAGVAEPQWDDPVNARVLGQKEWMAPVDDAETVRIDQVFEEARAARHDPSLSNASRAASIAAVKAVADRCYEQLARRQPAIRGRLIVGWTASASAGRGQVTNPRIKVNYRLQDAEFEACVLDGSSRASFRSADGEPIEVEAPFFYDGTF